MLSLLVIFNSHPLWGQHTLSLAPESSSPKATIEQFSFIAGSWEGTGLGGQTSEIWSVPSAGTMMGSFKMSQDGEIVFYEFCLLREVNETVLLQIKHFSKDFIGWEEKEQAIDFPLVKVIENKAFFDGLTFEKINDNELHIYVVLDDGDEASEEQFIFHRTK